MRAVNAVSFLKFCGYSRQVQTVISVQGQCQWHDEIPLNGPVSVFDRGFLYGDSLYEVFRTYQSRPFGLAEHLDRLEQSAKLTHMTLGFSRDSLQHEIINALRFFRSEYVRRVRSPAPDVYCRMIITRGAGAIGFGLKNLRSPCLRVLLLQPVNSFVAPDPEKNPDAGLRLQIVPRVRNPRAALDPAMKTGNYLNSLLAYLEMKPGTDDALLCDSQNFLTEGTTFNIFYIKRKIVVTPPLESGILEGITRRHTLQVARDLGVEVREVRFTPERLAEADEIFVTSSLKEAYPVLQLFSSTGHLLWQKKRAGVITLRLRRTLQQRIEQHAIQID